MDQRLIRLTEELVEAINESLTESERISEVIAKINAGGYDVSPSICSTTWGRSLRCAKKEDSCAMASCHARAARWWLTPLAPS